MNHIYRVLTFFLCFMVFNSWATTPTFETTLFTTCADRTASNTTRCMDDSYLNTRYGGYILLNGLDNHYTLENGRFQEFLDGTAQLTGQWVNIDRSDVIFDVDIKFSGRTTTAPNDPKGHLCLNANTSNFYYYPQTSGTLKGRNKVAGARIVVSRVGEAFQVGIGANVTNNELSFGASGWLAMAITAQPTTGFHLDLQTSRAGGNGDININLDGNPTVCFESDITLNCPNDITTVAQLGESGKVVTWTPPVATTTCMIGNGSTCTSTNLNGFEYLGEFNGSRYYCSDENTHTWLQARDRAIAAGGHLAVVCSQAENDFLRNGLLADYAWIGYADYVSEGDFKWVTGDNCGYTNWNPGEPNNHGGDEDFVRLLKSNGKWTDRNGDFRAEYIMEIPCQGSMEPGNVVTTQVAGPAPGSVFPIGMTEIRYEAIDACGNTEICAFKVIVEEAIDPCAGNGAPIVEVEVVDPECGEDNGKITFTFNDNSGRTNIEFSRDGGQTFPLNVSDNTGMAMFGDLAPGTYNIAVRWGNNECPVDLGSVTLEDVRQVAGTQCNDENGNTINDVISADGCTCEGTPIGEIRIICQNDTAEILQPGENGTVIIFDEPTANTTCGLDGLTIEQIEGLASGSVFPVGTTTIKYQVTDACGNMEMCSFDVVIEETPLMFDLLCADDIEIIAEVGENGAVVSFNEPSVISNCPSDNFTIIQIAGISSGNSFPVGTTTITYRVGDECGQVEECSFEVVVNPAPTGDITFVCNDDIEVTETVGENDGVVVTYNDPTAATTCSLDGLTIERTAGPASGSTFPIGTTTVTYTATDACGEAETCSFDITVNPAPTGDITFVCNDDIIVTETVGEDDGVVVTYNDPIASTTCSLDGLRVERTAGPASGSTFPIGTTTVTYMAVDACGEQETCSFDVTVNPAPTGEITFACNDDIEVTETVGESGVVVTYNDPTATSTCPVGAVNVTYISGLPSGSVFPVGTTTVIYEATDGCGGVDRCVFLVKVNPAPTGEIFLTCAEDQTITIGADASTAVVDYDEPVAITSCELDGLNVILVEGLPSGSEFPIGANLVIFEATDACGEVERCSLTITVIQIIDPCTNEIVIDNKICDDNGTPTDPTDDTYTFDVIVMRTGGAASSYIGSYDNGFLGAFAFTADYDEVVTLGPFPAGTFTSNNTNPPVIVEGGLDINVSIVDAEDPNCTDAVVVESTGPCSDELPNGSIGDQVFFDVNQNGIQDPEDTGVAGITVKLLNPANETLRTVETDDLGNYTFDEVTAGDYKVMVNLEDDFRYALTDQGNNDDLDSDILQDGMTEVFTLTPGESIDNIDAGLVRPIVIDLVKVGDIVFNDANGNGLQDNGEVGIEDVFVQLLDENGEVVQFTTSDENGMYMFSELLPGDYQLRFMGQSDDLIPTIQDEGDNDARDSDIDENGLTEVFTLVDGFDDTRDAGFQPRIVEPDPARIGNQVFLDENENGTRDNDETGIDGVEVKLIGANGDILQTVNTANGGMYAFSVMPGSYQVMFGTPFGFNPTNQSGNATDGIDNDSDNNPTTGMTELFTVTSGEVNPTIDAGFVAQPEPCDNVTDAGTVEADEDPQACGPYDATIITEVTAPAGGSGDLEYIWLASTITCPTELTDMIPGANDPEYDPGVLTQTTYFVRCARRVGCTVWIESNCIEKKVDACDNDGPVDCDAVTATVNGGIVKVDGLLGSNAKVEVIGAGTNWTPMLVCGDGGEVCENPQMIMNLPEGDYTVKIQLWGADGSYCYTERPVRVDGGEPTCEVDGGTIATNDDTTDLCVGDGEPSIVNFTVTGSNGSNRAWVVTDNNGTILNADAPNSIDFEGAGTGTCYVYYLRYETITGLAAGANIEDLAGCFDKSNRIEVSRTDDCGGEPTCTVDGGTIATTDNTTDLCVSDGEPSIVNFTVTGSNGPNRAWVVTDNNGMILNADAPNSIDFEGAGTGTCYVYYLRYETITGLEAGANIDDLAGCFDKSNRIEVSRTDNCGGGEEPVCDDVEVTTGNGKINLVGLAGQFVVVKIHDTNAGWVIIEQCVDCEDPTTFNVPAGDYNVVIEFYRGFWNDKYCRRDVRVVVTEGENPCEDKDNDGICVEEDCNDDDATVGARQTPGTSCDDGNALTINDVILEDGCSCAGEEDTTPTPEREVCIEREVFNTDNCQFNIIYGLYLKLDGYDEYYEVSDALFTEYTDGTALLTATAINNTSPNIGWDIEVEFGARTTLAEVAPKGHNCLAADVNDYYFYETLTGKLTGINDAAGASMSITRIGPAFQLGIAANITHKFFDFGGSGWFVADMLTQPTSGLSLVLNEGAQGQNGDININLSGDGTECIDGRDNDELDCANVSAIATVDGITISGLTAPIEIVKVFDANWVPVDNCTGDCGESITVATGPGNYVIRVNFYTANWVGECEVDIPVTVPASANSASSRTAPRISLNTFEENRAITLEWLTNTGYKNEAYVIEKSVDGFNFEAIQEQGNQEKSNELTYYKGVDNNPALGLNYYRVKQIYADGSFDYSNIKGINFKLDLTALTVFPNPAQEEVFVNLKNYAGKTADIQVTNAYGQLVQQVAIDNIPTQAIRLDASNFQNGLYHLSIRVGNSNVVTKKVLVNRPY